MKKMLKKFITSVLMSCMVLSLFASAFAEEAPGVPEIEPCDMVLTYDSVQAGGLVGENARGKEPPKKMYNLDGRDYRVSGVYDTTVHTEYYFYPNAGGVLFYNFTFEWARPPVAQVVATVEVWDKTAGKLAYSKSFALLRNGDGSYDSVCYTGPKMVDSLNPTHQYYIRFVKSFDKINATVKGTISSRG